MRYRIYVGIDTHSQKHCICAIMPETGSLIEHTIMGGVVAVADCFEGNVDSGILVSPLQCVYEAEPTGFPCIEPSKTGASIVLSQHLSSCRGGLIT